MPDSASGLTFFFRVYWTTFAFIVGAAVGSFLNVVIARLPKGESLMWPPSHCRSCGAKIRPSDNVPIFSWLILRGRCRGCGARFSARYALIELACGIVWAYAVLRHGPSLPALREIALLSFLIPLAAIDLDTWLLPRALTAPGIAVGVALAAGDGIYAALEHLLAAAIGFTALVIIGFLGERALGKEAIGRGDPWLLALIGAFLGWKALLPVVLLSSLQGSLIGGAMLLMRRRRERLTASASAPSPSAPANPGAEPAQPAAEPAQPGAEPAQPGAEPPRPAAEPARFAAEPPRPGAEPAQPGAEPPRPAAEPAQPGAEPPRPAAEPAQPGAEPPRPAAEPARSAAEPSRPAAEPAQPAAEPARPAAEPSQPAAEPPRPAAEPLQPELPASPAATSDEEDDWEPDPTAIPYGPFLALAAAEVLYFSRISETLFPF